MFQNLLEGEDISAVDQIIRAESMAAEMGVKTFAPGSRAYLSENHPYTVFGQ